MKTRYLYTLWGALFILCAGLGFIPEPTGALRFLLTVLSLVFFVPPVLLIWKHPTERHLIRSLSLLSLGLTLLVMVANFLTVFSSEFLGDLLHGILVVVSSPMICSGNWALSLFLWACLLITCLKKS